MFAGVEACGRHDARAIGQVERRLLELGDGVEDLVASLEEERPPAPDRTLELPISIYGGG